ncbi:MAG: PilZ domain-containing protein [Candidatus Wallbacteria bacterium]|nr:PilZ domain-containing protein [Candidatus Wallbacteria bacterium]
MALEDKGPPVRATESKPEYLKKIISNLPVEISVMAGLFKGNYLSRVVQVHREKEIFFEMPYQSGKSMKLWPQTLVYINFILENEPGAVYTFNGRIQRTGLDKNREVFALLMPEKILRVQRRNYVRISTSFPVNYLSYMQKTDLEDKEILVPVLKRGFSVDLSGGGILMRTPAILQKDQVILSSFKLGDTDYRIKSKIMHVIQVSRGRKCYYKYGLLFIDINETIRRSVIGYVFEVERRNIRKFKAKLY